MNTPKIIKFYNTRGPYGMLSNFSKHAIVLDGQRYISVEHFYQGQKTLDLARRELIRTAPHSGDAAAMGRDRKTILRSDWEHVKVPTMERAVLCKFETHTAICEVLLATGDATLVEDSPVDWFWGIGKDQTGKNMLGVILMRVRDSLRGSDLND